ncbi:DUF6497 family protein [Rhodovulum steppense]|uniref:Acetolactate synthase n=1 Tax=Rhodovulum steppense TaxID=540251 RepID=A0A4R1Z306_9RHOB|nr:DUF6497 family protein [Rhodovulum steppense]TCM88059.1 hypothetical protein EV216_10169 [Rhodovulum steppense]
MPESQTIRRPPRPATPVPGAGLAACRRFRRAHALVLVLAAGPLVAQELIDVPSGQSVTLFDAITGEPGPEGLTVRFRFLAPQIARAGGTMPYELAAGDIEYLCDNYALPRLSNIGPEVSQIVITLMDRPVPFGQPDPEATQFFEAFRPEDGRCLWEGF